MCSVEGQAVNISGPVGQAVLLRVLASALIVPRQR